MRPIEAILDADDHVMKAVYEMVSLNVSLIPVLHEGQLVGVVRSADVFRELAELFFAGTDAIKNVTEEDFEEGVRESARDYGITIPEWLDEVTK